MAVITVERSNGESGVGTVDYSTFDGSAQDGLDYEGVSGTLTCSGLFWFFSANNVEMLIKVLDACRDFDSFWVFFSATTNVAVDVRVTDTLTGQSKLYHNPLGHTAEPVQDTQSFLSCP